MALSNEDKHDVKRHLGKALANKVSKVTRDGGRQHASKVGKAVAKTGHYEMPEARKRQIYAAWAKADPSHPEAATWRKQAKEGSQSIFDAQDREDVATSKMMKSYAEKSKGARLSRKFLD